jgi:hypothetical protein
MAAVVTEVRDLAKSFEDAVFNNEDILTCVIAGVKYAEVVGAIEFVACTTFEKAQSTWRRIKDKYVQECKTFFFGFEPGLKNATVVSLDTLINITFTLKGPWATAFQGASAKVLMTKEDPMMELIEALGLTAIDLSANDAVPVTDVDRSHFLYLRLCRPDKFRVLDAPPRHLDATNVRFGTCKSVADKHDEIMAVAPDNGFMAMSIRLANGEESEQLEDMVVSMVRDNRFYEYDDGNNKFALVERMSYFYGIGDYDWEAFDYDAYRRVASAFAGDIWEACTSKFPNAIREDLKIPKL